LPALPNVPNVAKIQLRSTLGDDTNIQNTFHASFTGSPTPADANAWALAVVNSWVSEIAPLVTSAFVLNDCIVTDLTSATGAVGSDIANHAGTNAAASTPAAVAMVIRYEISRRYRGGHPRVYLAGLPFSDVTGENQWTTASINSMEAAWTLFMTAASAYSSSNVQAKAIVNVSYVDGHTWAQDSRGNWHREPVYRSSPITDIVTSYIVNPVCASQRRRNLQP
jgi:hypothetical protein